MVFRLCGAVRVCLRLCGSGVSADDLKAIPFGPHKYVVLKVPGSGRLADTLKSVIGNGSIVEQTLYAGEGVWVSPDTPEGHAVANALSAIIHEPVTVENQKPIEDAYKTPYAISVGYMPPGNSR